MDQVKIYKCRAGATGPYTYSVRKKCRFCREVLGEEREVAIKQMLIPNPTN